MAILPTGIGPVTGYNIERSLRFNSADSAYLSRTPSSTGSRRILTYSFWAKRSALGSFRGVLAGDGSVADDYMRFGVNITSDGFEVGRFDGSTIYEVATVASFRDPSAWYHFVIAMDTTQATNTNRIKIYVNNVQQTLSGTYPTQNLDLEYNTSGSPMNVGAWQAVSQYFNGYLTEVNLIDGQALTPSSFGETDSNTGVWKPKAFSGTYGTNGFYLKFADNSGTTSTTLGKDSSGNGNNWTPNNFSVTAGAGNDSLVDSPTSYGTDTGVGGSVRGNYCTLNPLNSAGSTLSNGNLDCVTAVSGGDGGRGTIAVTSGKWYWEFTPTNNGNQSFSGIALTTTASGSYYVAYYANTGNKFVIGSGSSAYGATYTNNDVIGVALDLDSGTKTVTFYKNNASQGAITITPSEPVLPIVDDGSGSAATTFNCNFGQRAFAYTAPSGFKALCTQNLPTPTIGATSTTQANDYFNILLYTGNSTTPNATRAITGVGFQPDFVWIKNRSAAPSHLLQNAVVGANKLLFSDGDSSEQTDWAYGHLNSFDSDGFTVDSGSDSSVNTAISTNRNNDNYVSWNWKANGAGSTNTAGTITSTVSANTTAGFSVVTYTGTGSSPQSIGHGLGATPSMIILKSRSSTSDWYVNHVSIGTNDLRLNLTNASAANNFFSAKSSTTFTINFNQTGNWVAYCFAPVAGYSAFGSYVGNGSTDGPFIYTGFRPKFILGKRSDAANGWFMFDGVRNDFNVADDYLAANASAAEATFVYGDFLSNGFKLRATTGDWNGSGGTIIYAAFAENPFKYSLAR